MSKIMNEHKCKGVLVDSTHGKLQKKKDALLEFTFAEKSLCLTVSAQNVNITSYTLSKDTIGSTVLRAELLAVNLKDKKVLKISGMEKNKLSELKHIVDCLSSGDFNGYQTVVENFCNNTTGSISQNDVTLVKPNLNSFHTGSTDLSSRKQPKIDKMKRHNESMENDENSHPSTSTNTSMITEKKTGPYSSSSISNFYSHSNVNHASLDQNGNHTVSIPQQPRKRTSENTQMSVSSNRSLHATSPYFFQRNSNKVERNLSAGQSRISLLSNIHSKPLNSNRSLWKDNDDDDDYDDAKNNDEIYAFDTDASYSTQRFNESLSTTATMTTAVNLRKKGLKNIGATCYMNSILQCLLNLDPFRYDLMVTNSELIKSSYLQENAIYLCVLKILALLQDRQATQSQQNTTTQLNDDERLVESEALINLKRAVEKHSGNFLGSRQQDSHEFLNLIISIITDEIDEIKIKLNEQPLLFKDNIVDPTTNNFQFCLATERCCEICGMSTIKTEIHTSLLIHVTDDESKTTTNNSLTNLLANYFAPESVDGCFCDNCQSNQRKYVKYNLEKLPRIFIFYLKRWHIIKNSNGELQSVSKEDHPIDCPIEINVYPFCSPTTCPPPMINDVQELPNLKDLLKQREDNLSIIEPKRAKLEEIYSDETEINDMDRVIATYADYRLFAVINHHGGSSDVGHYTSTVYDTKGDTWWTYDDTSVTPCTERRVLKELAPDAYGVMYMHKDIVTLFQPVINNSMQ